MVRQKMLIILELLLTFVLPSAFSRPPGIRFIKSGKVTSVGESGFVLSTLGTQTETGYF